MFCSTIIPTIGRVTLARAVGSVLAQELAADFEVIVVNDSGAPLAEAHWQRDPRVTLIETDRVERSLARNAGAAVARGRFLHFLDDDDLLLPGAWNALWQLQRESEAAWLYGAYRTVDNNGRLVEEIRAETIGNAFAPLVAGEGIPLQASLLRAETFAAVGGFDADPSLLGVEDRDLGRRIALVAELAYTPALVACVRIGRQGSTTDWTNLARADRLGRERALAAPGSLSRLRDSIASCRWHGQVRVAYWGGRVARAYVASAVWNLAHRRVLTAMRRLLSALAVAGSQVPRTDFRRGLRGPLVQG